jgi:3-methyladenine DNA glycosylase AlkD
MNKHYAEILAEIKKSVGKKSEDMAWVKKYMGTDKIFYSLRSETKKKIAKNFIKKYPNISLVGYIDLLNSLFAGKSHEEICVASRLLEFLPKLRKQLNPKVLDKWLDNACGWGEIDSICQSNFSAEELLDDWSGWEELILKFSKDKNISKRRASLVLLTKSVRNSSDSRLANLAFSNIDRLKLEKDILITKAISWLLRSLINHNSDIVKAYLEKNKYVLPKIAIRETARKLLTGRK